MVYQTSRTVSVWAFPVSIPNCSYQSWSRHQVFWLLSSSAFSTVSGTGSASAVVLDSALASSRSLAASGRWALRPKRVVSLMGPTTRLAALASERILDRKSASRCVMTTLHLGRDDRGKENAISPP